MDAYALVRWMEPKIDKNILVVAGEHKIMEVKKHWPASIWAMARLLLANLLLLADALATGPLYWLLLAVGLMVSTQALWSILGEFRDRFVVTNQRIFRVSGVLGTDRASMPILRILDITTKKSLMATSSSSPPPRSRG
jgi:uncharacterized membrane protein YdbT with pleckstrin-like domain